MTTFENSFFPACSQLTVVCVAPPSLDPLWDRLVPQRKGDQKRDGTVIWYPFDSGKANNCVPN